MGPLPADAAPFVPSPDRRPILLTGATGYIGGRLVPRLLEAGYAVRCLAREPRKLSARPWATHPAVEIVAGDASSRPSLERAMAGTRAAFYLIHSMLAAGPEYAGVDRDLARTFAGAAAASGVERIIYLGGLGETGPGSQRAPVLAPGGRGRARLDGRAGDGVPRGDDHRLRVGVVRDPALPGGAAAGDGDATLGAHREPADRRAERARVPGPLASPRRPRPAARWTSEARTSSRIAR